MDGVNMLYYCIIIYYCYILYVLTINIVLISSSNSRTSNYKNLSLVILIKYHNSCYWFLIKINYLILLINFKKKNTKTYFTLHITKGLFLVLSKITLTSIL